MVLLRIHACQQCNSYPAMFRSLNCMDSNGEQVTMRNPFV